MRRMSRRTTVSSVHSRLTIGDPWLLWNDVLSGVGKK